MFKQWIHNLEQRPALPLWIFYPPIFAAVYALHWTLLRLPYYWDEGGYYIPAAWDFYRFGTVIPVSTMRNAHPPLPSILLAGWWKIAGFSIYSTRLFVCLIAALALLAVFRIGRTLANDAIAAVAMVLTAIYPVWFSQSSLAHADIFAACATLWALSVYFERSAGPSVARWKPALCFFLFALSVMAKETAIITPAALSTFELWMLWRDWRDATARRDHVRWFAWIGATVLPLIAWYVYHHAATGFTFGNPEYLRYNATANTGPHRILLSLWHRFVHLTFHLNLYVVSACTLVMLWLAPLRSHAGEGRRWLPAYAAWAIGVIAIANWIAFSILGGALLTRYLLPVYPLLFILCVSLWWQRFKQWWVVALVALLGFSVACKVNPNYPYAPEDNLAYRDMIVLHQRAINYVAKHYPHASVLTAWPVAADIIRPELGYVRTKMQMVPLENFSMTEVMKAMGEQEKFDTAIVFSTKYMPPQIEHHAAANAMRNDAQYFDFHDDLMAADIAHLLHGDVVWEEHRAGEWAAVLRFPRAVVGTLWYDAPVLPPKL
ncbi:MAG: glycosyltransferase family 39 protein [Acidobacteria bacterium]|nr:glycosyltransferase family 39 protein [Acidobacteriota bacterium]